ncbi:hypothetical protein N2152v2_009178 [Parachlorella kessleri]
MAAMQVFKTSTLSVQLSLTRSLHHFHLVPTPKQHLGCRLTAQCLQARSATRLVVAAAETEAASAAPAAAAELPDVSKVDIRVGKILKCEAHPDADSLYVEQIDVGEEEPRTIVSGLVKYVPLDQMQDRMVLVLANLKPRNMRGVKSNGMLLCASNAEHTEVEPLSPPEGAAVGERVFFGEEGREQGEAANPNQLQKKKIWEAVQPLLKTDGERVAGFQGRPMLTSAGPVTASTLAGANIS